MARKKSSAGDAPCNADYQGHLCTRENHDDGFHSYDFEDAEAFRTSSDPNNERCEGYVDDSRCQRPVGHDGSCRIFRRFDNTLIPGDSESAQPRILS